MVQLHHVCIATTEYDRFRALFEKFGMTMKKETGEAPNRQFWFREGVQLKEVTTVEKGSNVDHFALSSADIPETVRIALENGCTQDPRGERWFALPDGTVIEMMPA